MQVAIDTEEDTRPADERDNENPRSVYEINLCSNGMVNGAKWVALHAIDYGKSTFESEAELGAGKTIPRIKPNLGGTHRGAPSCGLAPHDGALRLA